MEHKLKRAQKPISGQPESHTLTVWYKDVNSSRSQQASHLQQELLIRVTNNLCHPSTSGIECYTPRKA
jgi:hypothetical protein